MPAVGNIPIIPASERRRKQEDQKFKANPAYIVSLKPGCLQKTLSQQNANNKKNKKKEKEEREQGHSPSPV